jgi:hypothetical protein
MFALLTLDVARDLVSRQFAHDEPAEPRLTSAPAPRAPRTRSALSGVLHRAADAVAPTGYRTAH